MKVHPFIATILFLCILLGLSPAHADIYISTSGSDTTGTGEENDPYRTIQKGYDEAGQGERILVSPGTYDECVNATGQTVDVGGGQFEPKWVRILATDGDPTQTVISGANCTTVTIGGLDGELRGFTIRDGLVAGVSVIGSATIADNLIKNNSFSGSNGGGINVEATDTCTFGEIQVTITGNDIDTNWCSLDGGGIYVFAGHNLAYCQSDPITIDISNNTIHNNVAFDDGGGLEVQVDTLSGHRADVTVAANDFLNNQSPEFDSNGGGARVQLLGEGIETARVTGNTIDGNFTWDNGGGMNLRVDIPELGQKSLLVEDNIVTGNSADGDGGGMFIRLAVDRQLAAQAYSVIVDGNTFSGNSAGGDRFGGGGLLVRYDSEESLMADATLAEFRVIGNVLHGNSTEFVGGGLGIVVQSNLDPAGPGGCVATPAPADAMIEVENNLIYENDASPLLTSLGGGVVSLTQACTNGAATSVFRLNTIVENTTTAGAGGIELGMSSLFGGLARVVVSHTLLTHNDGNGIGGESEGTNVDVDVDHSNFFSNDVNYQSWIGDRTGSEGNVSVGPGYVSRASDNYHLTSSSNMVDAGARIPGPLPATDLDGDPRVVDGDEDGLTVVDIGYDEFFVCSDGDLDGFGFPVSGGDLCTEDNCPDDYNPGQSDCDGDLDGDVCDPDTVDGDGDQVDVNCDSDDGDPAVCGDADEDNCEDCVSGLSDPANDGNDSDNDGLCDAGDPDDDDDGVDDGDDSADLDPFACRDSDGDGCDDCTSGTFDANNDGTDDDGDGVCAAGDSDDGDPSACSDNDGDTCDDCANGSYDPMNDGPDSDSDGDCDAGDNDGDNDGVDNGLDSDDGDPDVCADTDDDTCDDCAVGTDDFGPLPDNDPANDGDDFDGDGLCDAGDPDDDDDGVDDPADSAPLDPSLCGDADGDSCEDCSGGPSDLIDAVFASDEDGFEYVDDAFRSTSEPAYADGAYEPAGGFAGGGLRVALGGVDEADIVGMSGGWQHSLFLSAPAEITLSFRYNLSIAGDYDDTELSQVLVALDGVLYGQGANDYVDQLTGGIATPQSTGWQQFQVDFGELPAGLHTVVIGGFNSQKTTTSESTEILLDDVTVSVPTIYNPTNDGPDADSDGICNATDGDDDNDGVDDGQDSDPLDPNVCRDTDNDTCDDCASGTDNPADDGPDQDTDGLCDDGDGDIDGDGVDNGDDGDPLDANVCRDTDNDTCDDCASGTDDPADDGPDQDTDGLCDDGDGDIDGDGVDNGVDGDPLDANVCRDTDDDTCDDCSGGSDDPANDGIDFDSDGRCDDGDTDDDNDGVLDGPDPAEQDPDACGDADSDTCDDCSVGTDDLGPLADNLTANDGPDQDSDGLCDAGDGDIDGDGVDNGVDGDPTDANVCRDTDSDNCDDCSSGSDDPASDGPDFDADGLCNTGDTDDDNDGVLDGPDPAEQNPDACGDADSDTCDDCSVGTDDLGPLADNLTANDGPDQDSDGLCDDGDGDVDGDGVDNGVDGDPTDANVCRDADDDDCDDCSSGSDDPASDGPDFDSDGLCDDGDTDDDNDGVLDGADTATQDPDVCGDSDGDTCDDCAVGSDDLGPLSDSLPANDGPDQDSDGLCDDGDGDIDGDGVDNGDDGDPTDANACRDIDNDACDDCTSGTDNPAVDGPDFDSDGLCNAGDTDDDNDGVLDGPDPATQDPDICGDADSDTCDDCTIGTDDLGLLADNLPANDGADFDLDGLCDAGDPDDDNDGTDDGDDCAPLINSVAQPAPALGATLRFAADKTNLSWIPVIDANVYNVYRGSVAAEADFAYNHSCLATEIIKTDMDDAASPASGELRYYLVSATNRCGGDGSLGTDSAAAQRPNDSACVALDDDTDTDGVSDIDDNCPAEINPDQLDTDRDGMGNLCDNCATISNILQTDFDGDDTGDACDTCTDSDGDTYGDAGFPVNTCPEDNCPAMADPDLNDGDADGIGDPCDACPGDAINDPDGDGLCTTEDNCPFLSNRNQFDQDDDDIGDACDSCTDTDGDGRGLSTDVCGRDNCPNVANAGQENADGDLSGDACDSCTDPDGDSYGSPGFPASVCVLDNCPDINNSQSDLDSDGIGDVCDVCTTNPDVGCLACPGDSDPDGDGACHTEVVAAEQGTALIWLANQSNPGFGIDWTTDAFVPDGSWQPGVYGIGYDESGAADLLIDTDVPFGSRSVYTRVAFEIPDAGQVLRVQIGADYDDGYMAWVNGDEIFRSPQMPIGEPDWDSLAVQSEASNLPEPRYTPFSDITTAGSNAIRTGTNLLAVGVWNQAPTSSDLVLVPRLSYFTSLDNCPDDPNPGQEDTDGDGVGDACDPCFDNPDPLCGDCPAGTDPDGDGVCIIENTVLQQGTSMLWLANQSNPGLGIDWTTDTFTPDGSWQPGTYGIGYDQSGAANNLISTDVPVGTWSVYTRVVINLPDAGEVLKVHIGADYDDGYMAWINGDEIFRSAEMPAGTPDWNTPSFQGESSNLPVPDYTPYSDVTAPANGALVTGDNVIAIGVWNTGDASSDLVLVPRVSYFSSLDNCPDTGNPGQEDTDGDGIGDACDPD